MPVACAICLYAAYCIWCCSYECVCVAYTLLFSVSLDLFSLLASDMLYNVACYVECIMFCVCVCACIGNDAGPYASCIFSIYFTYVFTIWSFDSSAMFLMITELCSSHISSLCQILANKSDFFQASVEYCSRDYLEICFQNALTNKYVTICSWPLPIIGIVCCTLAVMVGVAFFLNIILEIEQYIIF